MQSDRRPRLDDKQYRHDNRGRIDVPSRRIMCFNYPAKAGANSMITGMENTVTGLNGTFHSIYKFLSSFTALLPPEAIRGLWNVGGHLHR
jgi:hypothetical protein